MRAALESLSERGYRLAQAALDESAGPQAARDLVRGGMPRVTELLYLERDTALDLAPHGPGLPAGVGIAGRTDAQTFAGFAWRPYDAAIADEFRAVLQATYEGSLDMPELEGTRALEDILAGHQAAGLFVPARWQLGTIPGQSGSAAVLLMTEAPGREAWEVIYLGLTPPRAGAGWAAP